MIEVSEDMEIMCESCEGLKAEIVALKANLSKMTIDHAIQELNLLKKNKKLESKLDEKMYEISKLKKRNREADQKNKSLEEELFVMRTTPDIRVFF